ncbi:hypothetical protein BN871_DB_00010, partial [Paenibacillus sp. P22]
GAAGQSASQRTTCRCGAGSVSPRWRSASAAHPASISAACRRPMLLKPVSSHSSAARTAVSSGSLPHASTSSAPGRASSPAALQASFLHFAFSNHSRSISGTMVKPACQFPDNDRLMYTAASICSSSLTEPHARAGGRKKSTPLRLAADGCASPVPLLNKYSPSITELAPIGYSIFLRLDSAGSIPSQNGSLNQSSGRSRSTSTG